MKSKKERIADALSEYRAIADTAYSKYEKIRDSIEVESDDSLKSDIVQVIGGELTYFNTPQICHICKEVIQHGDEIEFDAPTFIINDMVHKSCKILSSEPEEQ